ncbi:uncharacterized protein N7484_001079 [Penicillium longicatenatum]|uniref:uncharacterized protein n=1 Tax=Penicillium longicatenatum TaxID=1561947 RepID=UPI0025481923|nr:uncharacterized protein N7484_001079 [Penicillium longicatenatum]KAJ5657430.1 hypothetical protein N7484_001079 [Penicillium longicatenatum]
MPSKGQGNLGQAIQENLWKRVLWGLPLFSLVCIGASAVGSTILNIRPHMEAILEQGFWTGSTGEIFSIHKSFYKLQFLDDIFQPIIMCFLPSFTGTDAHSWTQMFSFIPEFGAVYGIWLLEGYRKVHSRPGVLFPIIMGQAAQLLSVAVFGPLYYFLQYLQLSLHETVQSNNREIDPTCVYTLLAALAAAHYVPAYASFLVPDLQERQWWNAVWQIFPLTVPLLQLPLSFFLGQKLDPDATSVPARAENRKRSLAVIRVAYFSLAVISAVGFIYARAKAPVGSSMLVIFLPNVRGYVLGDASFEEGMARFMQYDQTSSMTAGFMWLGLRLRELKRSGVGFSWIRVVSALVGITCVFGPGTAFVLGWGWKEELLHRLGA